MTFYIRTLPQAFHELQFSLEVLDKGSIIFHDSAQGDKLVRGCPFFIPITHWKSIQSPQKKEATESRIHKKTDNEYIRNSCQSKMEGRILYIPMNQEVALHLLTFKLLRISAKAALEKRARHCCFQWIYLHIH